MKFGPEIQRTAQQQPNGNLSRNFKPSTKPRFIFFDDFYVVIGKAYDALPEGGAFIAIENLIDDARRENAFGLLMSLNMLIETGDGRPRRVSGTGDRSDD